MEQSQGVFSKIRGKLLQYKRTIDITVKPDKEEFVSSSKVSAFGVFLIGIFGFLIYLMYHFVLRGI